MKELVIIRSKILKPLEIYSTKTFRPLDFYSEKSFRPLDIDFVGFRRFEIYQRLFLEQVHSKTNLRLPLVTFSKRSVLSSYFDSCRNITLI